MSWSRGESVFVAALSFGLAVSVAENVRLHFPNLAEQILTRTKVVVDHTQPIIAQQVQSFIDKAEPVFQQAIQQGKKAFFERILSETLPSNDFDHSKAVIKIVIQPLTHSTGKATPYLYAIVLPEGKDVSPVSNESVPVKVTRFNPTIELAPSFFDGEMIRTPTGFKARYRPENGISVGPTIIEYNQTTHQGSITAGDTGTVGMEIYQGHNTLGAHRALQIPLRPLQTLPEGNSCQTWDGTLVECDRYQYRPSDQRAFYQSNLVNLTL
jgi:hypothetical protein